MKKFYFLISVFVLSFSFASAQEEDACSASFSVNADIVSNFVWRGAVASPTVNVQPYIEGAFGNFTIGAWGGTDFYGTYKEIDLYFDYTIKGFSATLVDYNWNPTQKYFDFGSNTTAHILEFGLTYENENFPLNIYAGTMLYGDDKEYYYNPNATDTTANNYSTYLQMSYTFDIHSNDLNVFMGATPFTGMYGNDFAVIYSGFTASREIKITENFSLSIFATFAANPQTQNYFTFFGISL